MAAKALLTIDLEIARLRKECEDGRANNVMIERMLRLLKQREELIPQVVAERQWAFAC